MMYDVSNSISEIQELSMRLRGKVRLKLQLKITFCGHVISVTIIKKKQLLANYTNERGRREGGVKPQWD